MVQGKPGTPIKEFYRSWLTALKKAGIPDDRIFHDFRRTAVRNMNRAKVPRQTAKKISGHKTDAIYNRYDIVDEDDIEVGVLLTQQYPYNADFGHIFSQNCACSLHKCMIVLVLYTNH